MPPFALVGEYSFMFMKLFFLSLLFTFLTLLVILMCRRHYDDKAAEAKQGFWNCPCVPMRERYDLLPK